MAADRALSLRAASDFITAEVAHVVAVLQPQHRVTGQLAARGNDAPGVTGA